MQPTVPSFYSLALHCQPHLSALHYLFGILKGSLTHEQTLEPRTKTLSASQNIEVLNFFSSNPKMPRKRLPIFHKVSSLLRISIVVAKMRKPIISKLIFLKKSRKLKRFKRLKHYSYGFLEEYEFSPSSTPLIHYPKKQFKLRSYKDNIYSMLFLCRCLGGLKAEGGEVQCRLPTDSTLPAATISNGEYLEPLDYLVDEEDSVDQRAERFIERFYQEMRLQRQESI